VDIRAVFPCDAASVGAARRLVRAQLVHSDRPRPSVHAEVVDAAGLLVSELVTNAIVHARTPVEVRVSVTDTVLRAEVSDGSPTLPAPRRPIGLVGTGRGLQLLEQVATRWGVLSTESGKTVWFELMLSGDGAGPASRSGQLGRSPIST
jgi:anti-sigma regulatory factor (Ser/Thr protein kinase)